MRTMKQNHPALLATLVLSFFLYAMLPAAPVAVDISAKAPPAFPLTVVKIKGRVKLKNKTLKVDNRITNIAQVKFDSTNNIVKVKDATGQGYFLVPKNYNLDGKKACTSATCKPVLMEKTVLPGGF